MMDDQIIGVRPVGWDVSRSELDPSGRLVLTARPREDGPTFCPICGSGELTSKGVTTGRLVDQPRAGRAVVIEATRDRWCCDDCGATFSAPMPEAIAGTRVTRDAYAYALEQSAVVPIDVLARTMGTPPSTLRRIVGDDGPPAIDDAEEAGLAERLAICPLCIRRYDRSVAVVRSVALDALPCGHRSRLPICPTCDEEGAPVALRG